MKKRCIDGVVGGKLSGEIVFNIARGVGVCLSPEQCRHLQECECCREQLPTLFKKANSIQKFDKALGITELAEKGDPRILRKQISSGTALFQPDEKEPAKGLLVLVDQTNTVHDPKEITLEDFRKLQ